MEEWETTNECTFVCFMYITRRTILFECKNCSIAHYTQIKADNVEKEEI